MKSLISDKPMKIFEIFIHSNQRAVLLRIGRETGIGFLQLGIEGA